jgi:hypothetical protein
MTASKRDTKRVAVARQVVAAQRSLSAFDHKDKQYLSQTVQEVMRECERAFSADDYARAEHLVKIIAYLVRRETPLFAANPARWIDRWQGLREERA